jgi:hypothetical protein
MHDPHNPPPGPSPSATPEEAPTQADLAATLATFAPTEQDRLLAIVAQQGLEGLRAELAILRKQGLLPSLPPSPPPPRSMTPAEEALAASLIAKITGRRR